ncbi:MAG: ABC transporter permease [Saprospiraceae bacterium]|nr:ABC transporter permease [Saprospiraceae bacterium]
MFQNYFKLGFRALWRNKLFAGLNSLGLAIGLAIVVLMLVFVQHELSFDAFHTNASRIYRVNLEMNFNGEKIYSAAAPNAVAPTAVEQVPGVENAVRVLENEFGADAFMRAGEVKLLERSLFFMDPAFLKLFDVKLLQGDANTALSGPDMAVISQNTAERYFGTENPVGKTLILDNMKTLQIKGVYKDFPENSTLHPNIVASFASVKWAQNLTWDNASYATYLLLAPNADPAVVSRALNDKMEENLPKERRFYTISLMPFLDVHLHSAEYGSSYAYHLGDYSEVKNLVWFALLVLLIACINYMNLTTARYQQRALDVGVNKTLGASRWALSLRFYIETGLLTGISIFFGLALATAFLPAFGELLDRKLVPHDLLTPQLLGYSAAIWLAVTFIAGAYPALFLSSFSAKKILSKQLGGGGSNESWMRKSLVVAQFSTAFVLMLGTFVMYQQMDFARQQKLGYNPENVVSLNTMGAASGKELVALQNNCRRVGGVLELCRTQAFPGKGGSVRSIPNPQNAEEQISVRTNRCDPGFVKTLDLKLLAGQEFKTKAEGDTVAHLVINEHLAKAMGWTPEEAIGKSIPEFISAKNEITGVVSDFHYDSFHEPIGPYCFHDGDTESRVNLLVRFQSGDLSGMIKQLEAAFNTALPTSAFDYTFLDDSLQNLYRSKQQKAKVVLYTALLAILISCLGLFGLSAFTTEQRTKEIGVRKVLGASVAGITGLLAKEFLLLVVVSLVIASPLAWYLMKNWLADFAYSIHLSWWMFAAVGFLAVAIAFLTVSFQSIKAAVKNPVESLRSE